MKDEHMIISLFYLVLNITHFIIATEIGSDVTTVINEQITDATSELTAKDDNTNISANLSPHREFKILSNRFPRDDVIEIQSNSSLLQQLESTSCEMEATRFEYKDNLRMTFHEILCELNKLLHYALIATQNLKSEFHVVIQYSPTQNAISLNESILNRILSDIVGKRIVRLEEFVENNKNVKTLLNSIKKCVPISNIQRTVNRLDIAVAKLLTYVQETFTYLEFHNDDKTLNDMIDKIDIGKNKIINFLHEYLSNNLYNTTDLLSTTNAWIELVFNTFKIYIQKRLYTYLNALEEFLYIVNICYDTYCESELSKTVTYLICSTSEFYNLLSSSITMVPNDMLEELTLNHSQNIARTSLEGSRIQSFSELIIPTHLPINMYNLTALNQMLLEPDGLRNSTPNKKILPTNYEKSNYVPLRSKSSSFLDTSRTSNHSLANYLSRLYYLSPTTISSATNIFQTFNTNIKEEISTPSSMLPSLLADEVFLEKPFPYTLRPEKSSVTHSTSDTTLYQTSNQLPETNITNFPIDSPFLEEQIAGNNSVNYTIPSNPSISSIE